MNRFLALGLLALGLALFGNAARSAPPGPGRVGVIDLYGTILTTPAGKRASAKFDQERKAKQVELDKKQNDLKRQATQLETQKSVMGPDVYKTRRAEVEKKIVEVQQTYEKLQQELAADRTRLMRDLVQQAKPLIQRVAQAEGISVVVDANSVIWSDPAIDITQRVNAELK